MFLVDNFNLKMFFSFRKILLIIVALSVFVPFAVDGLKLDDKERFFVEPSYDGERRRTVDAKLQTMTNNVYFFVDSKWWETLKNSERERYEKAFYDLGKEFENHIYPKTKDIFGTMPVHSVTRDDKKLTVFFHPMRTGAGGYFRTGDQYSIYRYSRSNERNIVYLNTEHITHHNINSFLAHEYMHLVTFNEKNVKSGSNEEVWLNELRSEIIITLLGYNKEHENSNLESRIDHFLRDPDISLTEWTEQVADYGVINLFGHYILDHYGKEVLIDSLHSDKIGIPSINYALRKNNIRKTFRDIFIDWTIAVYLNDCSYGDYYCYKNRHLREVRVHPAITVVSSSLSPHVINYQTKNWAGSWHEVVVERGNLYLDFVFNKDFSVPYLLCKDGGECRFYEISLDNNGRGRLFIEDFNLYYDSMIIIPTLAGKDVGFNGAESPVTFTIEIELKTIEEEKAEREMILEARRRLDLIARKLDNLYGQLKKEFFQEESIYVINNNLSYGMTNSREVEILQKFLKEQGKDIYPEGLITGNFYTKTKSAVIRFQEKYREEILAPFGLSSGTGFVGKYTREVINSKIK